MQSAHLSTPIGTLEVKGSEKGITAITFVDDVFESSSNPVLDSCLNQLQEYFDGKRSAFDSLHLRFPATDFQREVWDSLMEIPFGEVITYGELAKISGHTGAARAVGTAMNCNPLPIIIPCHRVLPSDKSVGEYAFGQDKKAWLLKHESLR